MTTDPMELDPTPGPSSAPDKTTSESEKPKKRTDLTAEQIEQHVESCIKKHKDMRPIHYRIHVLNLKKNWLKLSKNKQKKMLDIYCDNGKNLIRLLETDWGEYFSHVVGADTSLAAIKLANVIPTEYKNVKFRVLDLDEMNFNWYEKYDLITCFFNFDLVNDIERGFRRIDDMLEPNGCIMFTMVVECVLYEIIRNLISKDKWKRRLMNRRLPRAFLTTRGCRGVVTDIYGVLMELGFSYLSIHENEEHFSYSDSRLLREKVQTLNIFRYDMAAHFENQFYAEISNELAKRGLLEQRTDPNIMVYKVPMNVIYIGARKPQSAAGYFAEKAERENTAGEGQRRLMTEVSNIFEEFHMLDREDAARDMEINKVWKTRFAYSCA